jgi:hypothetical protein
MAKVISLFQLRGSIDDLTFRQTEYGTIAGMKPGPTREKVLTHEDFRLTRRNAGEFKLAIRDAQLLRKALGIALNGIAGSSLNGRMNGLLHTAARQDGTSDLGARRASQGDIGILTGFDFNKQLPLATALPVNFTHALDAATGTLKVALPCFIARKKKNFPAGATHFRIVSGGVAVNFLCPRYYGKHSRLLRDLKTFGSNDGSDLQIVANCLHIDANAHPAGNPSVLTLFHHAKGQVSMYERNGVAKTQLTIKT